jgi:hypothetical protein
MIPSFVPAVNTQQLSKNKGYEPREAQVKVLLFALSILISLTAHADSVLIGTDINLGPDRGPAVGLAHGYQFLAQGFTLNTAVRSTRIDTVLGNHSGSGDLPFLLELTNSLGPGSTVLASSNLNFAASGTLDNSIFSLPLGMDLGPGSYYLVLSSTVSGLFTPFDDANPPQALPSTVGSLSGFYITNLINVTVVDPVASVWRQQPGGAPLQVQLIGDIPEPPALSLMVAGLGMLWIVKRVAN